MAIVQLGELLLRHNIGTKARFCAGACQANRTELVGLLWPQLSIIEKERAATAASRGGYLQLLECLLSFLEDAYRDGSDADFEEVDSKPLHLLRRSRAVT